MTQAQKADAICHPGTGFHGTSSKLHLLSINSLQSYLLGVVEKEMNQPQTCPPETYKSVWGRVTEAILDH